MPYATNFTIPSPSSLEPYPTSWIWLGHFSTWPYLRPFSLQLHSLSCLSYYYIRNLYWSEVSPFPHFLELVTFNTSYMGCFLVISPSLNGPLERSFVTKQLFFLSEVEGSYSMGCVIAPSLSATGCMHHESWFLNWVSIVGFPFLTYPLQTYRKGNSYVCIHAHGWLKS